MKRARPAAVAEELRMFTRVKISVAGGRTAIGRIEDIRRPEDMPDIAGSGAPTDGEFAPRSILKEWGVSRLAMISYDVWPGQTVMFAALEIGGAWYDLKRQELVLEVVGQYEWPRSQVN